MTKEELEKELNKLEEIELLSENDIYVIKDIIKKV